MPDGPNRKDQNDQVGQHVDDNGNNVSRAVVDAVAWHTRIPDLLSRHTFADQDDDGGDIEDDIAYNKSDVDPVHTALFDWTEDSHV